MRHETTYFETTTSEIGRKCGRNWKAAAQCQIQYTVRIDLISPAARLLTMFPRNVNARTPDDRASVVKNHAQNVTTGMAKLGYKIQGTRHSTRRP